MNNLTIKQKIIFGLIIAFMVIFILIYFIVNAGNVMRSNEHSEELREEGILDLEDINETIDGMEEVESSNLEVSENGKKDENKEIIIHVTGEINKPGIVSLKENSRIADAINAAGGATKDADLNQINLAYVLEDGQKIYIPNKNEKIEDNKYIVSGNGNTVENNISKEGDKVNINEAMQTELEELPGIGPSLASRIIEYRETNGKFEKIDDLKNVKGIGDAKFGEIKDKVSI